MSRTGALEGRRVLPLFPMNISNVMGGGRQRSAARAIEGIAAALLGRRLALAKLLHYYCAHEHCAAQ